MESVILLQIFLMANFCPFISLFYHLYIMSFNCDKLRLYKNAVASKIMEGT